MNELFKLDFLSVQILLSPKRLLLIRDSEYFFRLFSLLHCENPDKLVQVFQGFANFVVTKFFVKCHSSNSLA